MRYHGPRELSADELQQFEEEVAKKLKVFHANLTQIQGQVEKMAEALERPEVRAVAGDIGYTRWIRLPTPDELKPDQDRKPTQEQKPIMRQ